MKNCRDNKIKLLQDLNSIAWFIEEYAEEDAQRCGHQKCRELMDHVEQEIDELLEDLCCCEDKSEHEHEHIK